MIIETIGKVVNLKRMRKGYIGLCPFHDEATPSFTVDNKQFYCFGCGLGGDEEEFIRLIEEKGGRTAGFKSDIYKGL